MCVCVCHENIFFPFPDAWMFFLSPLSCLYFLIFHIWFSLLLIFFCQVIKPWYYYLYSRKSSRSANFNIFRPLRLRIKQFQNAYFFANHILNQWQSYLSKCLETKSQIRVRFSLLLGTLQRSLEILVFSKNEQPACQMKSQDSCVRVHFILAYYWFNAVQWKCKAGFRDNTDSTMRDCWLVVIWAFFAQFLNHWSLPQSFAEKFSISYFISFQEACRWFDTYIVPTAQVQR